MHNAMQCLNMSHYQNDKSKNKGRYKQEENDKIVDKNSKRP